MAVKAPLPAPKNLGEPSAAALLELLRESLCRGHWKVAVRRYQMLLVAGVPVPMEERQACEQHTARIGSRELGRIRMDVSGWAKLVLGPRSTWRPGVASTVPTATDRRQFPFNVNAIIVRTDDESSLPIPGFSP
ncbi:hypothetical protein [uncultured Hydrogenophaga sp.]|uniref:hypothetical protein n=1 Tax=uncultured Hydrogenophaga sp. TaxID=199683 RepID=UPI00258D8CFB|nr:hypothetical protein [uncultured Hydrogenophaga sp.]